ncbi:MAG: L-threonylcarbamoyladenylate synthase [Calditrichia bacterium]
MAKIVRYLPEFTGEISSAAVQALTTEEFIVHPTDTVYGIAAVWDSEAAVQKVIRAKGRSPAQPFSIMVNSVEMLLQNSGHNQSWLVHLLKKLLPGALTVLLPAEKAGPIPYWKQFPLLGFRWPDHDLCNNLVRKAGCPLITTSANRTGEIAPAEFSEIDESILKQAAFAIDNESCGTGEPSTIIEVEMAKRSYRIIRQGSYSESKVERIFTDINS